MKIEFNFLFVWKRGCYQGLVVTNGISLRGCTMKKLNWIVAAACVSGSIFAGGVDSGGGDNHPMEWGVAWFQDGNRSFSRCYEAAEDFGADVAVVDRVFQATLAQWHDYFDSRLLLQKNAGRSYGFSTHSTLPKDDAGRETFDCKGDEDLKIYLGTSSPEVKRAAVAFDNPTAFPHRTAFNKKTMWGKGLLWFAKEDSISTAKGFPKWNEEQLHIIFLHELGHVLGADHYNNTVMDSRISEYMLSALTAGPRATSPLKKIDWRWELIECLTCSFEKRLNVFGRGESQTFKELAGRDVDGDIFIKLDFLKNPKEMTVKGYKFTPWAEISYRDNKGSYSIWLERQTEGSQFVTGSGIQYLSNFVGNIQRMFFPSAGSIRIVRVVLPNGTRKLGRVVRNSTSLISTGSPQPLKVVSDEDNGTFIYEREWFVGSY